MKQELSTSKQALSQSDKELIRVVSGAVSGVTTTIVTQPMSRALWMSVRNHRPLCRWENFGGVGEMFHGLTHSLTYRVFAQGIFYVLQDQMKEFLYPLLRSEYGFSDGAANTAVGSTTGTMVGFILSPMGAVRYQIWGREGARLCPTALYMFKHGGIRPFLNGMGTMVTREVMFASVYQPLRMKFRAAVKDLDGELLKKYNFNFVCDFLAAFLGGVVAAPFNYARNMKYSSTPKQQAPTLLTIWGDLWRQSQERHKTVLGRTKYIAEQRFRIGSGTVLMGATMALGQWVFDTTNAAMQNELATRRPK